MNKENTMNKPSINVVVSKPNKKKGLSASAQVPVGIEKLLYVAAKDKTFKNNLLKNRKAAIIDSGVKLRPSEIAMLTAISNDALNTMIENIVPENPKRRKFMGMVAAAAASIAAGAVEIRCKDSTVLDGGTSSDIDVDSDSDTDSDIDGGPDSGTDTDTVELDSETEFSGGSNSDTSCDCRTPGAK